MLALTSGLLRHRQQATTCLPLPSPHPQQQPTRLLPQQLRWLLVCQPVPWVARAGRLSAAAGPLPSSQPPTLPLGQPARGQALLLQRQMLLIQRRLLTVCRCSSRKALLMRTLLQLLLLLVQQRASLMRLRCSSRQEGLLLLPQRMLARVCLHAAA